MKINQNYLNLKDDYLFANIAQKVNAFKAANHEASIIRLGIGDVTLPLSQPTVTALKQAADDMGKKETFKGYGEYAGYPFLRTAIKDYFKSDKGVDIDIDEIFVSDGAKSDLGGILDIFSEDNVVLIPDPVYPVYVDTNIMQGRKVIFANGVESNGFLPLPDSSVKADIIYMCSPNNPSGAVYNREQLKAWVDYANANGAVILFDSAYEAFITDKSLPTSILQIEGAATCAIEFCSFSKMAGFTGTRCGFVIVPKQLTVGGISLNKMWYRRQSTKFNGTSYIIQRGAEAVFSKEGREAVKESVSYYLGNAKILRESLSKMGVWFVGGENSPYVWLKCPKGLTSWQLFDKLLNEAFVVGTPGSGFGKNGEGFFRLTAFGERQNVIEAMERIKRAKIFD